MRGVKFDLAGLVNDAALTKVLEDSGSSDRKVAQKALALLIQTMGTPIRQGIMDGDIVSGIFTREIIKQGTTPEYPLDWLVPGTEADWGAYTVPFHGYIPQRSFSHDNVMISAYEIANAIDWPIQYAKNARWNVVARALEVYANGFIRKFNDDGWATIITAAYDREVLVTDGKAAEDEITPRLFTLMSVLMRRNGGGNTASQAGFRLTDVFMSTEAIAAMREWDLSLVPENVRSRIFNANSFQPIVGLFGITFNELMELGIGQQYQLFYENALQATMPGNTKEIVIGLDLRDKERFFVMPVTETLQTFDDESMHRQRRLGVYGWTSAGFATLDNRPTILGAY
jgi:hypothetical protein